MKRTQPAGRAAGLVLAALALALAAPGARSDEGAPATGAETKAPATHDHHDMGAMAKPAGDPGEYMTIVGEVMDPACFLEAGAKSIGPGHYQCAFDCVRSGQTLALYDRAKDRIYFIAGELPGQNPNRPLLPYIHKKVDVSGRVYHRADAWGIVIVKVAPHQEGATPASAERKAAPSDGKPAPSAGKAAPK